MHQTLIQKNTSDKTRVASFTHAASSFVEKLGSSNIQQRMQALRIKHAELKNILESFH
jgi:hypothetical protein